MSNEAELCDAEEAYWAERAAREVDAMRREEDAHYRMLEAEWDAHLALEHADPAVAVHEEKP